MKVERLFIFRLWCDENENWHVSLKDMKTGKVKYFHTLDSLIEFLEKRRFIKKTSDKSTNENS